MKHNNLEWRDITLDIKDQYNSLVSHPLQTYEWGEFRKKTGIQVIRRGLFDNTKLIDAVTITLHPIPKTPWNLGYIPKGKLPDEHLIHELEHTGKKYNCISLQFEPNVVKKTDTFVDAKLTSSFHPLFTPYTFILDITHPEEELLKNMQGKTRYNIKVAQKHGVVVEEDNSDVAFKTYLNLTDETTQRQRFYAHSKQYHELMWKALKPETNNPSIELRVNEEPTTNNSLTAHLLTARYKDEILVTWILFVFKDTLYYPYGASSTKHREVMASNMMMWEAIRFGKKLGLKNFDMWGALGKDPDPKDPWYGFHRFKQGYGGQLTELVGSYDFILKPSLYHTLKLADKLRNFYLIIKR